MVGSIPFGYILGRAMGSDLLSNGSKSIGATNALRTLGPVPAVLTLILDMGKAVVSVLVARHLLAGYDTVTQAVPWQSYAAVIAAVAVIVGHSWSVFLRFRGGKSVAASAGSALMIVPTLLPVGVVVFVLTVVITRYVSLGSMLGTLSIAVAAMVAPTPPEVKVFVVLVTLIVIIRHRANIARLRAGTESRFGDRVKH